MPYIAPHRREGVESKIRPLLSWLRDQNWDHGAVTYLLFRLLGQWYYDKPRFSTIASVLGVLDATRLEFYRRFGVSHENNAMAQHGDVYHDTPRRGEDADTGNNVAGCDDQGSGS